MGNKANNVRVHVILTERQYTKVQALAGKTGYSISELMRRAVDTYLGKAEKSSD